MEYLSKYSPLPRFVILSYRCVFNKSLPLNFHHSPITFVLNNYDALKFTLSSSVYPPPWHASLLPIGRNLKFLAQQTHSGFFQSPTIALLLIYSFTQVIFVILLNIYFLNMLNKAQSTNLGNLQSSREKRQAEVLRSGRDYVFGVSIHYSGSMRERVGDFSEPHILGKDSQTSDATPES